MANNKIQHYRTTVPGRKPDASKMLEGQLALNIADKRVYTKLGTGVVNIGFGADATVEGGNTWTGTVKAARLEADTIKTTSNVSFDSLVVEKTATIKSNVGIDGTLRVNGAVTFNSKVTGADAQFGVTSLGNTTTTNLTSTGTVTTGWLVAGEHTTLKKGLGVIGDITAGTIRAGGWLITDNTRIQVRNEGTKQLQFANSTDTFECGAIISDAPTWLKGWRVCLRSNGDPNTDAWLQADGVWSAKRLYSREQVYAGEAALYGDGNISGSRWSNNWAGEWQNYLTNWLEQRFSAVSDIKFKQDVKPAKPVLDDIKKIDFVSFNWKDDVMLFGKNKHVNHGFIAQEVEKIDDSIIYEAEGHGKAVDVLQVAVMALQAAKELTLKVESLEKEVAALKKSRK